MTLHVPEDLLKFAHVMAGGLANLSCIRSEFGKSEVWKRKSQIALLHFPRPQMSLNFGYLRLMVPTQIKTVWQMHDVLGSNLIEIGVTHLE